MSVQNGTSGGIEFLITQEFFECVVNLYPPGPLSAVWGTDGAFQLAPTNELGHGVQLFRGRRIVALFQVLNGLNGVDVVLGLGGFSTQTNLIGLDAIKVGVLGYSSGRYMYWGRTISLIWSGFRCGLLARESVSWIAALTSESRCLSAFPSRCRRANVLGRCSSQWFRASAFKILNRRLCGSGWSGCLSGIGGCSFLYSRFFGRFWQPRFGRFGHFGFVGLLDHIEGSPEHRPHPLAHILDHLLGPGSKINGLRSTSSRESFKVKPSKCEHIGYILRIEPDVELVPTGFLPEPFSSFIGCVFGEDGVLGSTLGLSRRLPA